MFLLPRCHSREGNGFPPSDSQTKLVVWPARIDWNGSSLKRGALGLTMTITEVRGQLELYLDPPWLKLGTWHSKVVLSRSTETFLSITLQSPFTGLISYTVFESGKIEELFRCQMHVKFSDLGTQGKSKSSPKNDNLIECKTITFIILAKLTFLDIVRFVRNSYKTI